MILDSGNRTEFDTGAVRDIQEGKGRCDLIPLSVIADIGEYDHVLGDLGEFQKRGSSFWIRLAVKEFVEAFCDSAEDAYLELAIHYEEGAKKYAPNNWKKGIPTSCFLSSGVRHYLKFRRGDKDERHDRAFIWNMVGLAWTLENKPELNDIEFDNKETNNEE